MTPRVRGAIVIAVFVVVACARIALIGALQDQGYLITYVDLADRILDGSHPVIADVSPVYLGLVVALRKFGIALQTIRGLNIALATLAAFFCALAAKRLAGWTAAIATAVILLTNRALLVVTAELDPKALILLFTSAALAAIVYRRHALAGLLLGISAATHPYGFLVLLVALIVALIAAWRNAWRVAIAAAIPIMLVMVLSPVEQHAGSQLYEGNNALASGCGGVAPRVVVELQRRLHAVSPDPIYRMIAERAGGDPSRYWRDKSLAFMRTYPRAALRLFARKALLTVHHFDVYDVLTARRRARELARYPAMPFGVAFVLAVAALVLHADRRELLPIAGIALILIAALTVFVVSARQRNVLLAPLAILAGVGTAEVLALARARNEAALLALGATLIAGAMLGIETQPMREYDYMERTMLRLPVDPLSPPRVFDRALASPRERDALLATLDDYHPYRLNTAVSSVGYYRGDVARAMREAPGDPNVLALAGDVETLRKLHDPLTVLECGSASYRSVLP